VTIDTRVIAATNRDLEADVGAGRFREDLFFRLNVVVIALPPLRERVADLPALTDALLARLYTRHGRPPATLTADARRLLAGYRWPGNVRELVNVLERAIVLSAKDTIGAEDLPDRLLAPAEAAPASGREASLEQMERRHIQQVLADAATLEEAAARLGINVTTLWRKPQALRHRLTACHGLLTERADRGRRLRKRSAPARARCPMTPVARRACVWPLPCKVHERGGR
jgi:NtrC-family two-component system response regulator AlgB